MAGGEAGGDARRQHKRGRRGWFAASHSHRFPAALGEHSLPANQHPPRQREAAPPRCRPPPLSRQAPGPLRCFLSDLRRTSSPHDPEGSRGTRHAARTLRSSRPSPRAALLVDGSARPSRGTVREPLTLGFPHRRAGLRRGQRALVEPERPAASRILRICGLAGRAGGSVIDCPGLESRWICSCRLERLAGLPAADAGRRLPRRGRPRL